MSKYLRVKITTKRNNVIIINDWKNIPDDEVVRQYLYDRYGEANVSFTECPYQEASTAEEVARLLDAILEEEE